jgi:hypothetical protein
MTVQTAGAKSAISLSADDPFLKIERNIAVG